MPISLSDQLGVGSELFRNKGVFDPILDVDTRLFIDPHLLETTKCRELLRSYERVSGHFTNLCHLLAECREVGDPMWRQAFRMLKWGEAKGVCIGYSTTTAGRGSGKVIRTRILHTALAIIRAGVSRPQIFELVGLFEKDIGPDRISDMVASIIQPDLIAFTLRSISEICPDYRNKISVSRTLGLPINPVNGEELLLVPQDILRSLPVALDWNDRDMVFRESAALREKFNALIGESWKAAIKARSKEQFRDLIVENPDIAKDLFDSYAIKQGFPYDIEKDSEGRYQWYSLAKAMASSSPLKLSLEAIPTVDDVFNVVNCICKQFKSLIENNGWWKLLYMEDGRPKKEEAIQLLFYGVCEAYCVANSIMLARESNGGRGPVDFKFGTTHENSVLVEIKKSDNPGLLKGVRNQLPTYMNSEKSRRAIYLVVEVDLTDVTIERLKQLTLDIHGSAITVIRVDGQPVRSASHLGAAEIVEINAFED